MSEIGPINYSFQVTYAQRMALAMAEFRRMGWRGWVLKWIFYISFAIALVIEFVVIRWIYSDPRLPVDEHNFILMGVVATIVAISCAMLVTCMAQRSVWRSVSRDYEVRHGRIGPDGLAERRGALESKCGWAGIVSVERLPDVTLLCLGEGSGYVVPHDALPDGITPDALHERIDEWNRAAR